MSIPDNYPDPFEWAVECEQRAEKAEAELKAAIARINELESTKLIGRISANNNPPPVDSCPASEVPAHKHVVLAEHYNLLLAYYTAKSSALKQMRQ